MRKITLFHQKRNCSPVRFAGAIFYDRAVYLINKSVLGQLVTFVSQFRDRFWSGSYFYGIAAIR